MSLITAEFDSASAVSDSAYFYVVWPFISLDQYTMVNLDVQTPTSIDFTLLNRNRGTHTINIEVPKNNTGNIDIFNDYGNINFYLLKTASAKLIFSAPSGYVVFNNLIPTKTVNQSNSFFEGEHNSGAGAIVITTNYGSIFINGVDSLSHSP